MIRQKTVTNQTKPVKSGMANLLSATQACFEPHMACKHAWPGMIKYLQLLNGQLAQASVLPSSQARPDRTAHTQQQHQPTGPAAAAETATVAEDGW